MKPNSSKGFVELRWRFSGATGIAWPRRHDWRHRAARHCFGIAGEMLTKFGLEAVLVAIYQERQRKGESAKYLLQEISKLPLSGDLKRKLRNAIA